METKELINRFLEETGLDTKDDILVIIVYGSRVRGNYSINSDLDIFAITSSHRNLKIGRIIDGVKVECNIYSFNKMYQLLLKSHFGGNNYFDSVLKTGIVIKDKDDIVSVLKSHLDEFKNIYLTKNKLNDNIIDEFAISYCNYNNAVERGLDKNLIDYEYFNLLEKIRKAYHYVNRYSYLSFFKIYDAYLNKDIFQDSYLLKLPNDEFINTYLAAIREVDINRRTQFLKYFFSLLNVDLNLLEYYSCEFNDELDILCEDEIKETLVICNNLINKVIEFFCTNNEYSLFAYYNLLKQLYELYICVNGDDEVIESLVRDAKKCEENQDRINILEKIFRLISKDYLFDYDDYVLKLML